MNSNERFLNPGIRRLNILINISRWILLVIGFISISSLNYRFLIELPAIPYPNILITAVIFIWNILTTWLSLEVKNTAMAGVLLFMELINISILLLLFGTQFALLVLLIPIMESALFIESITFIIIILMVIVVVLAAIKEIVIEVDKTVIPPFSGLDDLIKEGIKGLTRKLMFLSLLGSVAVAGLIHWLFKQLIDEGKKQEKERKRVNEERLLFQQEIEQLNDKITRNYRETDGANTQIVKFEEEIENLQSALTQQQSITRVINLISSSKNPEEAIDRAIRNIEKIVPCQTSCIFLVEEIEGQKELVPAKISSPFTDILANMVIPWGQGLIGWVAQTGKSALLKNGTFTPPGQRELLLPALLEHEPSALAVPLSFQNNVAGVLYISHPGKNAIDEESEEILKSVNMLLTTMISEKPVETGQKDTKKEKEREAIFRQKEQEMSNLIETMQNMIENNQKIFQTLDLRGTLERIVETINNTINCQTCIIFLEKRVDGNTVLYASSVSGPYADYFKNYSIKPEEEIIGYVYRTQKDVIIGDSIYKSSEKKETKEYKVLLKYERSAIIMPLNMDQRVLGVIYISRPEPNVYTKQEQELLSIISHYSVLAINNALEYEKSVSMAITDEITGLENKIYFERRLLEELARSRRFDFGFALALIDIDQFTRFNSLYGKEVGDHLLREIAALLSSYCREADCISRLENDMYGILLLHINKNDAVMTTERLRTFIESKTFGADLGEAIQLTVCMGVSVYPDDGDVAESLFEQALVSLEEAKKSGGNKTFFMG